MKPYLLTFILVFSFAFVNAQGVIKEADRAMEAGNFRAAATLIESYVDKGGAIKDPIKLKLAKAYVNINQFEKANKIYEEVNLVLAAPEDTYLYGRTLQHFAVYDQAIEQFNSAEKQGYGDSLIVRNAIESCLWAKEHMDEPVKATLKKSNIRTFGQSFGITYYKDGVVYSSSGQEQEIVDYNVPGINDKSVDQLGLSFLNIFYSPLDKEVQVGKPVLFSEQLQFDYHVGACAFQPDYKFMYYTKSVKIGSDEDILKIFRAEFDSVSWGNEVELSFNNESYNCAHPALSLSGDTLYFISDMPGGEGGKDIYMAIKIADDWSDAINLGSEINTIGDEMFPTISVDGTFCFSSNYHLGFGGLDIFKAELKSDGSYTITNMMMPINSSFDDFAYVLNPEDSDVGFVSSNREEKGKRDYIYNMEKIKEAPVADKSGKAGSKEGASEGAGDLATAGDDIAKYPFKLSTIVKNALSGEDLAGALVLISVQGTADIVGRGTTGSDGLVNIDYVANKSMLMDENPIQIVATKGEDFEPYVKLLSKERFLSLTTDNYDIRLTPIIKEKETIVTLRDEKFTFTFDSYILGYNAKQILEDWREFLLNNPDTRIRLNAHTDSRGSLDYNLELSQKRAESARSYLIQRGISPKRIIPRGYGERYLLNVCKDDVDCSESEHEANRRVEIIINKR